MITHSTAMYTTPIKVKTFMKKLFTNIKIEFQFSLFNITFKKKKIVKEIRKEN